MKRSFEILQKHDEWIFIGYKNKKPIVEYKFSKEDIALRAAYDWVRCKNEVTDA